MMNGLTTLKSTIINIVLIISLIGISGCTSPEDKANKFYENGMQLLEKGDLVKANVEFRNALQFNKKLTKAIWGQYLIAEKQSKPRQQFKLLKTILINEPGHLEALVKFGRLLLLAGQIDEALEKSDAAIKVNSSDLSVLSLQAAVKLKKGETSAANKIAKNILTRDPFYIDALMILATERLTAGDKQKAIDYLDKGLEKHEKNIALQFMKIKVLEDSNKFTLAEELYKKLINDHPKVTSFNTLLVQFYLKQGKKESAEKVYKTIIKNNPNNIKAKFDLIQLLNDVIGVDVGLNQLKLFIKKSPDNKELKFALVKFYLAQKENILASEILEDILTDQADTKNIIKAKNIKAGLFLAQGNKSSAEKIIDEVLSLDKNNQNSLILKASLDIDRQNFDKAIAGLRLVLRDIPESSKALFLLAKAYKLSGSLELADKQYLKAFKASKFNAGYGMKYADFLLKRNQPERAEKILNNILTTSQNNLSALMLLAKIKLKLTDWDAAQKIADVIKKSGNNTDAANQIKNAVMLGRKKYSESIIQLKKQYKSNPENMNALLALIKAYQLAEREEEAEEFINEASKRHPHDSNLDILKAKLYSSQGKKEKAISVYQKIIEKDPKNAISYHYLSMIYLKEKKYQKSKGLLSKGLSLTPNNMPMLLTLAQVHEATGEFDKAINVYENLFENNADADIVANNLASLLTDKRTDKESFSRAYNISKRFKGSDIPQFKDTLAWASYRVGKHKDAHSLLESAIKTLPNIAYFHYHLGMNYLATKNTALAKKELERALMLAENKPFSKTKEIKIILEKL